MDDVKMDMMALARAVSSRWLRILVVTLVLLAATFVALKFVPRLYESEAAILVETRSNAFTSANGVTQSSLAADEAAVSSQIEVIRSRGNLIQVIRDENLADVPEFNGRDTSLLGTLIGLVFRSQSNENSLEEIVLGKVAKKLTVARERDSRIIAVRFMSEDPELAARIANAIANTHVKRRAGAFLDDTAEASQWLEAEIDKLRKRVSEAEAKVASYRVDNDLFTGDNQTSLLDQQLSDIAAQISAAQERGSQARSRAMLIRGLLEAGQPIDGVPDVRESVVVVQLSEEKARLQGERAQLLATLLPNHPSILALSAQIKEINKQVQTEGRQVADALEAEAKIEATLESSLRDQLTRLKIEASTATKGTVGLNELEREAKAQRDLLETYLLRYRDATSRTESSAALPDVRVISIAAASLKPASPKTTLILTAVAFVSVMLQVGHIIFAELVSGRALVQVGIREEAYEDAYDEEDDYDPDPQTMQQAAPIAAPPPRQRATRRAATAEASYVAPALISIGDLAADIAREDVRLVVHATLASGSASQQIVEDLTADLVSSGCSTAEIDVGSRQKTSDLGITDLCAGLADFGEVVHRGRRSDFALVPWGQQQKLDPASPRVETLIEALLDVFEIALVDTGRLGMTSALPAFADFNATVVVTLPEDVSGADIDDLRAEIASLGFDDIRMVSSTSSSARAA